VQVDDRLDREHGERRREQAQIAEVVVRAVAHAAAVVGQRDMEVRRAFGAVAVADLPVADLTAARFVLGAALVHAVVGAERRVGVGVGVGDCTVMAVRVVMSLIMMRHPCEREAGGLAVHMRPAAGVERDADGVPGRHADHHLREQEERKHEAEGGAAHGAGEEP